jgi:hypothetical protein
MPLPALLAIKPAGLQSPDAMTGSVPMGSTTAVIYVEKQLGVDAAFFWSARTRRPLR